MTETLEQRNILLGVTGSIAAYKAAELARILVQRGYAVRCVMTKAAQEFITPMTLQAITGSPVVSDFWDGSETTGIGHIQLADWADVIVVAPASADIIGKLAAGFAENPLLASILASKSPLVVAPAMNVNMYEHVKTQENINTLRQRGAILVDAEEGALACGWNGTGRMADPFEIFFHVRKALSRPDYAGRRILITTGPTREPIDPVRFISNRSSGKMGIALAQEAFRRGAQVTLIHGPISVDKVSKAVNKVPVTTAQEMHDAVMQHTFDAQEPPEIVIMAAAVADFRSKEIADQKIKRRGAVPELELEANRDILQDLGNRRSEEKRPILVGFAVETGELEELLTEARDKMKRKKADMIVGNFAQEAFDLDTNRAWIVDKTGRQEEISTTFKNRVAAKILDAILRL